MRSNRRCGCFWCVEVVKVDIIIIESPLTPTAGLSNLALTLHSILTPQLVMVKFTLRCSGGWASKLRPAPCMLAGTVSVKLPHCCRVGRSCSHGHPVKLLSCTYSLSFKFPAESLKSFSLIFPSLQTVHFVCVLKFMFCWSLLRHGKLSTMYLSGNSYSTRPVRLSIWQLGKHIFASLMMVGSLKRKRFLYMTTYSCSWIWPCM